MKTIKRILVPIDFSENSASAFQYALDLGEKFKADVKVVHVYETTTLTSTFGTFPETPNLEAEIKSFVEENITDDDDNGVVTRRKVNVETEVYYAPVNTQLVELSQAGYDLFVMGMVGQRTLGEIVFGSVATYVSQNAHCPVLLVPYGKHFKKVKNLAYACDFDHKSFKHPAIVADVANMFKADVHLVFVKTPEKTRDDYMTDLNDMKYVFEKQAPSLKYNGYIVEEEDVFYGINNFSHTHKIDMIVMVTKHRNFWQRVFHPSITKELAMYSDLPLLVIKAVD
jgi:nucleotide-binding universal stress UspA family protein